MGLAEVAVACGVENMSSAPYLLRHVRRGGHHYGHSLLEDSALLDGLTDASLECHIGRLAEKTAQRLGISRADQDAYTVESYRRVAEAWQSGAMDKEVSVVRMRNPQPTNLTDPKMVFVSADEEYSRLDIDTVASLPPLFDDAGTITAASASSLNDGAAALVLVSAEHAWNLGVGTLARIVSFADQGVEPDDFAVAPAGAVRRALRLARMSTVDFHEIHETFAVVALANAGLLNLDFTRVNVNGGAVALGHPLGASGVRILCSLLSVLEQRGAATGCASIANAGGGATALVV